MAGMHERNLVLKHALRSEENLDIALTIGSVYEEIRGQVIGQFTATVAKELASRLGQDWQVAADPVAADFVGEMVVAIHQGHAANVYLTLAADGNLARYPPYLGARCKNPEALPPDKREQLKDALDEQYGPGKVSDCSLWWRFVEKTYADWNSQETLLRLYRKGEALAYFVGHLEKLAAVVQSVLGPQPALKTRQGGT